jgi:DNA recombination protein RmuC
MTDILLLLVLLFSVAVLLLLVFRKQKIENDPLTLQLDDGLKKLEYLQEQVLKTMKDDFQRNREESSRQLLQNRQELAKSLGSFEQRLEKVRETIEMKLKDIQMDNSKRLEEMRQTVDEKLQETLNKRISESFKLVSERLELVQKGLGEMSELATGVGDLKKVLQNVKTRGVLGEVQLGAILEQFLSPEQFVHNAKIKTGTTENVEYAVRLPGKDDEEELLLPIDSKFPMEDYLRLLEIYDHIDNYSKDEIQRAENQFVTIVKKAARTISEKYLAPPKTTNFALMFVPTEGLYSQILRIGGLFEGLQRDFSITVVGPSNLVAFLSSLQMGFRTLAVQKRSDEVWRILGAVKTEFGKFEDVLKKAQQQLSQASNNIDTLVGARTRTIQRKLKEVEELPNKGSGELLGLDNAEPDTDE